MVRIERRAEAAGSTLVDGHHRRASVPSMRATMGMAMEYRRYLVAVQRLLETGSTPERIQLGGLSLHRRLDR
jgi:hypothetical protein